ncbi:MAG: glycosyltransferase family 39 protein [Candidatus Sumerlaeales bacterium]|nr:glycosyltransferase family 39 protein [Candidatus Sumerlaeales bacterium]
MSECKQHCAPQKDSCLADCCPEGVQILITPANTTDNRGGLSLGRDKLFRYAVIAMLVLIAIATRFVWLSEKPLHHDESLFAYYAYELFIGNGYVYQPILHGALLQNVNAFFFLLFGDSKFTMRLPVVLGALALLPLLWYWRHYLGRWGMVGAMAAVVFSPTLCYYGRFLRNDVPFAVVICWCALCVLRAMQTGRAHYWFWGITGAVLAFCMMESSIFFFACCVGYLVVVSVADWLAGRRLPLTQPRQTPTGEVACPAIVDAPTREKKTRQICLTSLLMSIIIGGLLMLLAWRLWPGAMSILPGIIAPMLCWVIMIFVCWVVIAFGQTQACFPTGKMGVAGAFVRNFNSNRLVILTALLLGIAFYQMLFTTWFTNVRGTDFKGNPVVLTAIQLYKNTWDYWWDQHLLHRIKGPFHYHLPIIFMYELPLLLFIAWSRWRWMIHDRDGVRHTLWLVIPQVVLAIISAICGSMGLIHWGWMDKTFHLTSPVHLQLVLFYVQVLLYFVPVLFLRKRFIESFLIFWFITMLFAYSYAGEKVPWLSVHIVVPACLLFGYDVQVFYERYRTTHKPLWRTRTLWVIVAAALIWQFRLLCFVCFIHPHSPAERLVYNHTHPDVEIAVEDFRKIAHDTGLGIYIPYFMEGEVSWPLYWYLRDTRNPMAEEGETLDTTTRPVVIADWYQASTNTNIMQNYVASRLKIREWWEPPMLDIKRLCGIWRYALPTARLDTPSMIALTKSQIEWGKLFHYILWREIWLDTKDKEFSNSGNEFAFCTRRDIYDRYLSVRALRSREIRRELPTYPPRTESPVTADMLRLWGDLATPEPENNTETTGLVKDNSIRIEDDETTTENLTLNAKGADTTDIVLFP